MAPRLRPATKLDGGGSGSVADEDVPAGKGERVGTAVSVRGEDNVGDGQGEGKGGAEGESDAATRVEDTEPVANG